MSEFTYLFRGRQTPSSPEQRQKHREKWVAWFKDLNGKGVIKNPGHPLEDTGKVVNGSQKTVKDGPGWATPVANAPNSLRIGCASDGGRHRGLESYWRALCGK